MNTAHSTPTAYRFRTERQARAEMTKWADALTPEAGAEWAEVMLYKFAGHSGWWLLNEAADALLGEADPQGVVEYAAEYDEYLGDNLGTSYQPPAEALADIDPIVAAVKAKADAITGRWEREEAEAQAELAAWEAGGEWVEAA